MAVREWTTGQAIVVVVAVELGGTFTVSLLNVLFELGFPPGYGPRMFAAAVLTMPIWVPLLFVAYRRRPPDDKPQPSVEPSTNRAR